MIFFFEKIYCFEYVFVGVCGGKIENRMFIFIEFVI